MIRRVRADLHVHTALSPCADNDMVPPRIFVQVLRKHLEVIAITDHNSAENVPAFVEAGNDLGVVVVPGIEVQTVEEVHVLCLFATVEQVLAFQQTVYEHLPRLDNREDIFGLQLIVDREGKVTGKLDRLLLTSTDLTVGAVAKEVNEHGGICIPAHVDRPAYSLLSVLGFIPWNLGFPALEISPNVSGEDMRRRHPRLGLYRLVTSSDAHRLTDVGRVWTEIQVENLAADGIIKALARAG